MRLKTFARATCVVVFAFLFVFINGSCTSNTQSDWSAKSANRLPAGMFAPNSEYGKDSSPEYFSAPEAKALKTRAEFLGRDIWIKATGGNDRFHTYVLGQRASNRNMNFWRLLASRSRGTRFNDWGLMNDPDCCTPGEAGCPKKSLAETYGMDYCPGDDELLQYVGRKDADSTYRDPACDMDLASMDESGAKLQSACDLKFGTSTGAVGFRKFPNPRFDKEKWLKVQGNSMESWDGYSRQIDDTSIEPPFRIGMSCAGCHVSFDPVRPPKDPNHPTWMNLSATVGNQYEYTSQIIGAGFEPSTIQAQMMTNARPGTVDTSAVSNDQVNNPGTINAIMNFNRRPTFTETVDGWRTVQSCPAGASEDSCTCNASGARCYQKSKQTENVMHVLKGGEDTAGEAGAVLRVYINIGTCSEQCWMNNLMDFFVLDKKSRNYGQNPFNIGQCRRDCPSYRALEDRVGMERDFLFASQPFDLYKAKGYSTPDELIPYIEQERGFGDGSVGRGRQVFAQNCARCHSSQKDSLENRDFLAKDNKGRRIDWLGSDERINADEVGTYECRSQHSNHTRGHIWDQYSSEDYKAQGEVHNLTVNGTNGRGHYRAISLLSVWAFAPFMHNNAVGPEVCGNAAYGPKIKIAGVDKCEAFDPSIEGRLKLFEASMSQLMNPASRGTKTTLTSSDIVIPLGPPIPAKDPTAESFALVIPKGMRVSRIGSFRHKDFIADLAAAISNKLSLGLMNATAEQKQMASETLKALAEDMKKSKNHQLVLSEELLKKLGTAYSNCTDEFEDKGHSFGAELAEGQKKDLTAFMETL